MLKDAVNCGTSARVESHGPVEDFDDLLWHLWEHLVKAFLLAAFQALQVLLRVFIGKEFHFLSSGLAKSAQDHGKLVVSTLRIAI